MDKLFRQLIEEVFEHSTNPLNSKISTQLSSIFKKKIRSQFMDIASELYYDDFGFFDHRLTFIFSYNQFLTVTDIKFDFDDMSIEFQQKKV